MAGRTTTVPVLEGDDATPRAFVGSVQSSRSPAVLRGVDVGPCVARWGDPEYLASKVGAGSTAKVHVARERNMDFRAKNFLYRVMPLQDVFRLAANGSGEEERLYLREVGSDPRGREVARIDRDFPELAKDFRLPDGYFDTSRLFSSVLRVSSPGVRVWTHYDVMDNLYVQVSGRKRAVLWAPDQALNLYMDGDKSRVLEVDGPPSDEFPLFWRASRQEADLLPGDVLFIPAMWFHNMTALDAGVAVNVFWRNLDDKVYDGKDVYGNRDLLPAAKAGRMLDNVIRQLDGLPSDIRDFYGRQLISKIEKRCLASQLHAS